MWRDLYLITLKPVTMKRLISTISQWLKNIRDKFDRGSDDFDMNNPYLIF
jgi:hypothetical protein